MQHQKSINQHSNLRDRTPARAFEAPITILSDNENHLNNSDDSSTQNGDLKEQIDEEGSDNLDDIDVVYKTQIDAVGPDQE